MASNVEPGTKTLGQALGLAAQPVTPGFPAKDQQEESKGVTGAYAGPLRVEGGGKQLGSASKIVKQLEPLARGINGTSTATPDPAKGPLGDPTMPVRNPLTSPMMPNGNPLTSPTAPVVTSGTQPGGLIDAIRQLAHTSPTKEPRYTTMTGAPTDNPVARSANGASKRQLADVSGIEDAAQSSAEKGLEA